MVKIDQDIFDLSVSNALNAFSLDKKVNIKYLGNASFNIEISGNRIEELFKNNKLPKFLVAGDKELGTKKADFRNGVSLLNSESSPISLNIQVTKVGELKKLFSFDKYDFEEGVYASLGHITGPDLQNEQLETVEISTSNDENVLGFSAYPNPFNPSTTISFSLQNDQNVNLTVYDLLGRKVAVLIDGRRTSGLNQVTFDASGLASGIYFYRISFGNNLITKRFTLLK
ncbi:MAG: T9SS type A sorting domain-containing protein [Balneola sp.]